MTKEKVVKAQRALDTIRKWQRDGMPTRQCSPYGHLTDDREAIKAGLHDAATALESLLERDGAS